MKKWASRVGRMIGFIAAQNWGWPATYDQQAPSEDELLQRVVNMAEQT